MPGSSDKGTHEKPDLAAEWFENIGDTLEQGDVLFDFPLPVITYEVESDKLGLAKAKRDVIVLTQSCDLPKPAQTEVLLATVFSYADLKEQDDNFKSSAFRDALRRGVAVSEFALPPRPGGDGQFLVVSFRKLQVVPKAYLFAHLPDQSLRLRSPYKEYFAQAYARFMMRVGLPLPLPALK